MHAIHWFEIPATDLTRAMTFYARVLALDDVTRFRREQAVGLDMAIFPYDPSARGVGGAIAQGRSLQPAATGTVVYLNAGQDIRGAVDRAVEAGGSIRLPVTDIGAPGLIAWIQDSEGNIVGLHQPPAGRRD